MFTDALTKMMSSAALAALCSAKKVKRSQVHFAPWVAGAVTA